MILLYAICAHLIVDVLLQNAWMNKHKISLAHPAAWAHGATHLGAMAMIFPLPVALGVAVSHMVIDTKAPLLAWNRIYLHNEGAGAALEMAQDQTLHLLCLVVAAGISQ